MTRDYKMGFLQRTAAAIMGAVLGQQRGVYHQTGRYRETPAVGAGVARARAREAAYLAQQDERLKNAEPPPVSRQVKRSYAIRGR